VDDATEQLLGRLHSEFLKQNEHDEGDLLFYRINYRLADTLHISKDDAEKCHAEYHAKKPRRVSEGFCDGCLEVVNLIPIIYGVQDSELSAIKARENQGRLIIGDARIIKQGVKIAMFGCMKCRKPLPKYGSL